MLLSADVHSTISTMDTQKSLKDLLRQLPQHRKGAVYTGTDAVDKLNYYLNLISCILMY